MADSPRVYFLYTTIGANERGQKKRVRWNESLFPPTEQKTQNGGDIDRPATIDFASLPT